MFIYDVTIAILTFHPDVKKMLLTLDAVLSQENISFEVLICDDGSEEHYDDIWEDCFRRYGFEHYRILNAPSNQGTVKNCLNAAERANGKYLFLTSPGDLLYDRQTLRKLFEYAEKTGSKICFGNAIFYQSDQEKGCYEIFENLEHAPEVLSVYERLH